MEHIEQLIERLRLEANHGAFVPFTLARQAADALDVYRKATGELPLDLVAKALDHTRHFGEPEMSFHGFTPDEIVDLETATFEAPA
jgi:alkyl sulfatase BDS1-like metallo-beta-lactamase superfamily hydrolase